MRTQDKDGVFFEKCTARGDCTDNGPGSICFEGTGCKYHADNQGITDYQHCVQPSQVLKQDDGKPRWELVPLHALEGIAIVMGDAVRPGPNGELPRYKEHSWQKVDPKRYYAAMMRHITDLQQGLLVTHDTNMNTLDAILTNAMFLRWFQVKGYDMDELIPGGADVQAFIE